VFRPDLRRTQLAIFSAGRWTLQDKVEPAKPATKQKIAETIAQQVPAFSLYVPPKRKPWMSEDPRMGIFEAAALAWMYFQGREGDRQTA
jgi:hypothetical protein